MAGIAEVAAQAGVKVEVVKGVLESIKKLAASEKKVSFKGYGTFSFKERAERKGKNPQTGDPIQIPAKRVFSFRASRK